MSAQAITLCRVSTLGQKRDGNLDPQIERVNKAADFLDAEIIQRWEIAASSRKGKNIKRKDLREMRDFCRHNKRVKYLIVDEVDRFMRSINEYYWWKQEFQNIGVQLIHANKPGVDPNDQAAVFDELIDVYKAEQSNNERITKTPEKQMSKMRAGYYCFAPLPGYRKAATKSLHEPDPERFYLLQTAFKSVANGSATPNEALKCMNDSGYTTVNGNKMDMARFRQIIVKPYYDGTIQVSDWEVATLNGRHTPMITKAERASILFIMSGKKKKFAINKKNPEFPMNETLCWDCENEQQAQDKITGYRNHNGKSKDPSNRHYYQRYRCRGCKTYFTRQELHDKVASKLENTVLDERELLIKELTTQWHSHVGDNQNKVTALKNREHTISQQQTDMALEMAVTHSETVKQAMASAIESKEQEKLAVQADIKALSDIDTEIESFIAYAIDYTENLKSKYWSLDWDRRKRCELLLFPDGFYINRQKKVYTPRISPIYRDTSIQKEPRKAPDLSYGGPHELKIEPRYPGEPELPRYTEDFLQGKLSAGEGLEMFDPSLAEQAFYNDVDDEALVEEMIGRLHIQKRPPLDGTLPPAIPPEITAYAVLGSLDNVLNIERARRAAQEWLGEKAIIVERPWGHTPQLSQPAELAKLLTELLIAKPSIPRQSNHKQNQTHR